MNWSKIQRTIALLYFFSSLIAIGIILHKNYDLRWADWTGFGKDSNISEEETLQNGKLTLTKRITHFQSGKTLWDWLGLLGVIAIPVALFLFQQQEQRRSDKQAENEKEIADINLREEALRDYIDKMADLLIDKKLRRLHKLYISDAFSKGSFKFDELDAVLDIARARTLSILRRLDGDGVRKGSVVHFLMDAELIEGLGILREANLIGAQLSFVNLSFTDLNETDFSKALLSFSKINNANLIIANFFQTNLERAVLEDSILRGAIFYKACLMDASLQRSNLKRANFQDANLERVNFKGADLEGANFKGAKNLDVNQVKVALNWELAYYDLEFRQQLGLLPENVT